MRHRRRGVILTGALMGALIAVLSLAACHGPSNDGGDNPIPVPSPSPVPDLGPDSGSGAGRAAQVFRFEYYGEYEGTVYMDVTQALPWYFDRTHPEDLLAGDIPGTLLPPREAECFTFYEGRFYYLCPFDYSDGSAVANVPLYVAGADGSAPKVLIAGVCAESNPLIVNGILYYERFLFAQTPEGEGYDYEPADGGHVVGGWDEGRELRALDLTTGEDTLLMDAQYDPMQDMLIGATASHLVAVTDGVSNGVTGETEFQVTHLTFAGAVGQSFTVKTEADSQGSILGVDELGNIVVESKYAFDDRIIDLYNSSGERFDRLHTRVAAYFAPVLAYYDEDGWLRGYRTVNETGPDSFNMDDNQIRNPERVSMQIVYYGTEPLAGDSICYEFCQHFWGVGTFEDVLTGESTYSIFAYPGHEADDWAAGDGWDGKGPSTRRVLPYATVEWRSTGTDWKGANAYVLQWSEIDFYSYEQLATLTDEALFFGRNEMFWAHGNDFTATVKDAELQQFFAAKTWPQELEYEMFTQAELWNLKLIRQIEADRNSPYRDRGYTINPV